MRNTFVSIISLFLIGTPEPVRAAFYTLGDLPVRPSAGVIERASSATHRITMETGSNCSGVVLSPDGYVLTALHCMDLCLEQAGVSSRRRRTHELYSLYEIGEQAPKDLVCPRFGASYWLSEHDAVSPRVVWLGRGTETFDDARVEELPAEVISEIKGLIGDYAILKYDLPGPAACLPPARETPRPGETLWALGYPDWTKRDSGHNSAGVHQQHISFGARRGSIREDAYLRTIFSSEAPWRLEESIFDQPHVLIADLDVYGGSSGGPVINDKGEIVAVVYSSIHASATEELHASALGISLASVVAEVRRGLGETKAAEIFNCPAADRPVALRPEAREGLLRARETLDILGASLTKPAL